MSGFMQAPKPQIIGGSWQVADYAIGSYEHSCMGYMAGPDAAANAAFGAARAGVLSRMTGAMGATLAVGSNVLIAIRVNGSVKQRIDFSEADGSANKDADQATWPPFAFSRQNGIDAVMTVTGAATGTIIPRFGALIT